MNEYLIPANSKKSQLYFGVFKGIDLIILGIGFIIEIPFLFIDFKFNSTLLALFIKLLPIAITLFLLIPIANYHNMRVLLREIYLYIKNRINYPKGYYWRGWCATYGINEQSKD